MTFIATRRLRLAMAATLAALAGALIGGALMIHFGKVAPEATEAFLLHIPGIKADLLHRVNDQLGQQGLLALLLGPLNGIPYKIYAVEWGRQHGSAKAFLLMSVPARWLRFALIVLVTRAAAILFKPFTGSRRAIEWSVLTIVWIVFYAFYFTRFGW